MGLRHLWKLALAATAAGGLCGCVSFTVSKPADGDIVKLPASTSVVVTASPSMTALQVSVDGNVVTGQVNYVSDTTSQGALNLAAGNHTLLASATVPCWYCSPQAWQASMQRKFCVAPQNSAATPSQTAFAKGDNLSWANIGDTSVGVAADTGTLATRWNPIRLGGFASSIGLLQSTADSCLCMRSTDAAQNTPIGLAVCDASDVLQQWQALQIQPGKFRVQNNGRGVSDACLTEGASGVLVQQSCLDTPGQLWSFKDTVTGNFGSPF